jgi:hypothetical protein
LITLISTVPEPGGATAVIEEPLATDTEVDETNPKNAVAAGWKFAPVMVTAVPPAGRPYEGETPAICGGGAAIPEE